MTIQKSVNDQLTELGRKACKVCRKARYAHNKVGIIFRIFVCLHKLVAVQNIYIYKCSALLKVPLNQRKNGVNTFLVGRNVRVKLNLQRCGISIAALNRSDSV